jgi:hypothetical protein
MIGVITGQAFNLVKANRVTNWSTVVGAEGKSIPVATTTFAMYSEGNQYLAYLQFRGENAMKRLKLHFGSTMNAIMFSGHLDQYHLPDSDEKYSYSDMTVAVENGEQLDTTGKMVTVIVVDSFDPSIGINPNTMREQAVRSGYEGFEVNMTPKFSGLVSVNTTITSDGPKYTFGRGNARGDPSKVRYSVSGIARNGTSMGKLRIEIHGKARVDIMENLLRMNNSIFVTGNLVAYSTTTPGVVDYAIWVNQFMACNLGNVQTLDGNVMGVVDVEGVSVSAINNGSSNEDWDTVYTDSNSSISKMFNLDGMDEEIPF